MRNLCSNHGFLDSLNHRIAHRREALDDIAYCSRGKRNPKDAPQNLVDAIYTDGSDRVKGSNQGLQMISILHMGANTFRK